MSIKIKPMQEDEAKKLSELHLEPGDTFKQEGSYYITVIAINSNRDKMFVNLTKGIFVSKFPDALVTPVDLILEESK